MIQTPTLGTGHLSKDELEVEVTFLKWAEVQQLNFARVGGGVWSDSRKLWENKRLHKDSETPSPGLKTGFPV